LKPKLIYTGIRVKNMDDSVKFYTEVMGMKLRGTNSFDETGGEVAILASEVGGHWDSHWVGGLLPFHFFDHSGVGFVDHSAQL
jgi:catechol 2,3-dioxygenase-like lactoylglutathione lyase family enzyme